MTGETGTATPAESSEATASVLITVTTPGANTPICRLGNSESLIGNLTVRELVERVISPNSLVSVGVPMTQLEAESPTALAISELLSADSCEVLAAGRGGQDPQPVPLDNSVREVAREQVGTQGNKFLNISLQVRSTEDTAPLGDERRQVSLPETVESESDASPARKPPPMQPPASPPAAKQPVPPASPATEQAGPSALGSPGGDDEPAAPAVQPAAVEPSTSSSASSSTSDAQPAQERPGNEDIVTIVAEAQEEEPPDEPAERKEYVRKSDWLRAQFLPEVEALDFSGLFVGNLGLGIREEKGRRNVVLADPSRITDVLLRANGYRRSGDHAKALICYQELVDMDPANADFRFLLGKTLAALGQDDEAVDALTRAKELGHDGASKELESMKGDGGRPRSPLGFLKFWKQ